MDLIRPDGFLVPPFKDGVGFDFAMGVLAGLWVYTLDLVVAYQCVCGTGLCGLGSVRHYVPSLWSFCGSLGIHLRDPPSQGFFPSLGPAPPFFPGSPFFSWTPPMGT